MPAQLMTFSLYTFGGAAVGWFLFGGPVIDGVPTGWAVMVGALAGLALQFRTQIVEAFKPTPPVQQLPGFAVTSPADKADAAGAGQVTCVCGHVFTRPLLASATCPAC